MITRRTADKWSLKKWIWFSKHSDPGKKEDENHELLTEAIPRLREFTCYCGYCEYLDDHGFCPLAKVYNKKCRGCIPTYLKWQKNCTKANAKKVLSDIRKAIKIREPK